MTISSALSNALSGLTASARAADVVSSNVANALTEGYGRRAIETAVRVGGGVEVAGVTRLVDQAVIADRRLSQAAAGGAEVLAGFYADLESALGTPGSDGSLTMRYADFESALVAAGSAPDSTARLATVVEAATAITEAFAEIADSIQSARIEADQEIGRSVATMNASLSRIAELNVEIQSESARGLDVNALVDQRQTLVDGIAAIVPIREYQRDGGQIALYTTGGLALLDGRPAEIAFDTTPVITADMSLDQGTLSPLMVNGRAVAISGETGPFAGGALAALLDLRDSASIQAQAWLDAAARDLVERFQSPAADPTLTSGMAGLFTDAGAAFSTANEAGLSARLSVNAMVDPAAGGEVWRIRDGLGALTPGAAGDADGLLALLSAFSVLRTPASGGLSDAARTAAGFAADLLSAVGTARQSAEGDLTFHAARQQALRETELSGGVDTDQEMQSLLLIEQAYAANARVIQTVGEMIDRLLGI